MRQPRVFRTALFIGHRDWREVLGLEQHLGQVEAFVLCPLKAHAQQILTDCGYRYDLDLRIDPASTQMKAITAAGLLTPGGPPVIYYAAQKDRAIAKVTGDGTAVVVAHWRYESGRDGRGLWIEPCSPRP